MKKTDNKHYIGITGVADKRELLMIVERCKDLSLPTNYHLNVGVLLSYHTFNGVMPHNPIYPDKNATFDLLEIISEKGWNPVIHYTSTSPETLSNQVFEIFNHKQVFKRSICRTIQLNVMSPEPQELVKIYKEIPDLKVILQVPMWWNHLATLKSLCLFTKTYADFVSYLLFDSSGGYGKELTMDTLKVISSIVHNLPVHIGISIAGGLSDANVFEKCLQIRSVIHRDFSIDSQAKLRGRIKGQKKIGNHVNSEKVNFYILNAINALTQISDDRVE